MDRAADLRHLERVEKLELREKVKFLTEWKDESLERERIGRDDLETAQRQATALRKALVIAAQQYHEVICIEETRSDDPTYTSCGEFVCAERQAFLETTGETEPASIVECPCVKSKRGDLCDACYDHYSARHVSEPASPAGTHCSRCMIEGCDRYKGRIRKPEAAPEC